MSAQVYSVTGQTKVRKKVYLEWTGIDLSSKLSPTCGGNVNYYKSIHHHFSTQPVGIGNTLAIFKKNGKLSFQLSVEVYSLFGQTEGERSLFWMVQEVG